MAKINKDCEACGKPIHPERLAAIPQTKVCGPACGEERNKRLNAERQKRWRQRQKQGGKNVNGLKNNRR